MTEYNKWRQRLEELADMKKAVGVAFREHMQKDQHYGVIPGTQKPTLLQPGAQLIASMFNYGAEFSRTLYHLDGGHREVSVTCTLIDREHGTHVGNGIGTCSTLEERYRYRWQDTGQPVPKKYWDSRDDSMFPEGCQAKKIKGNWVVARRVENEDLANEYVTVEKMAAKRAYVHAVLMATGASDIFTQDIEDNPRFSGEAEAPAPEPEPEITPDHPKIATLLEVLKHRKEYTQLDNHGCHVFAMEKAKFSGRQFNEALLDEFIESARKKAQQRGGEVEA